MEKELVVTYAREPGKVLAATAALCMALSYVVNKGVMARSLLFSYRAGLAIAVATVTWLAYLFIVRVATFTSYRLTIKGLHYRGFFRE